MGSVSLTLVNIEQRVHLDLKTTLMSQNHHADVLAHPCNVGYYNYEWSALPCPPQGYWSPIPVKVRVGKNSGIGSVVAVVTLAATLFSPCINIHRVAVGIIEHLRFEVRLA